VADPVRAARGAGCAGTGRIPLAHSYRLLVKAEHDENFKVLADMRDLHEDHEFIAKDLLPSTRWDAASRVCLCHCHLYLTVCPSVWMWLG
jgi:hypothetical protein